MTTQGRVGRPIGYRMSEESKSKTSVSRTGQKHDRETKEKISDSVNNYWGNPYRSDRHREKLINLFKKEN